MWASLQARRSTLFEGEALLRGWRQRSFFHLPFLVAQHGGRELPSGPGRVAPRRRDDHSAEILAVRIEKTSGCLV